MMIDILMVLLIVLPAPIIVLSIYFILNIYNHYLDTRQMLKLFRKELINSQHFKYKNYEVVELLASINVDDTIDPTSLEGMIMANKLPRALFEEELMPKLYKLCSYWYERDIPTNKQVLKMGIKILKDKEN